MKNKMKIILFSILVISISAVTSGYLYTKEKVAQLGESAGSTGFYNGPLNLVDMLESNLYSVGSDNLEYDANFNLIRNGWRDLLAADPALAYSAFDTYSKTFIENFRIGFENSKKDAISSKLKYPTDDSQFEIERMLSLNADDILRMSVANIRIYQILIDDLLKLDDVKLNTFLNSLSTDPCCAYIDNPQEEKELKKWLMTNGHIKNVQEVINPGIPHFMSYPTDLLLLTKRISMNYPNWTNRRALQEMKKFSVHVQNNIDLR
jgi:hypothetical protein